MINAYIKSLLPTLTDVDEKRRNFLKASVALLLFGISEAEASSSKKLIVGDSKINDKYHVVRSGIDSGEAEYSQLDFRPHGFFPYPAEPTFVLVVARRPGKKIILMDARTGKTVVEHEAMPNHYLSGHACYHKDLLYVVENNVVTRTGVISIRNPRSLKVMGAFPTYGTAPHEIAIDSARNRLYVANGGVQAIPTDPQKIYDSRDVQLMRSTICAFDMSSGAFMQEWSLSDQFLSMRHIALNKESSLGIGIQPAHPSPEDRLNPPCFALLKADTLNIVPESAGLHGYAGGIAADQEGRFIFAASRADAFVRRELDGTLSQITLKNPCSIVVDGAMAIGLSQEGAGGLMLSAAGHKSFDSAINWGNHACIVEI